MKYSKTLIFLIITLTLLLDWGSKYYFNSYYPYAKYFPILGEQFFGWMLIYNKGVSFSIGASDSALGQYLFGGFATTVGLILCYLAFKQNSLIAKSFKSKNNNDQSSSSKLDAISCFAYALIGAGGLGNGIERLLTGHVVDFISFTFGSYHFPVFNIADISINIGVFLLITIAILSYRSVSSSKN